MKDKKGKEKYYHYQLEEINGEQEYFYDYLIETGSLVEATEIAGAHAGSFYDNAPERIDGAYSFFDGTILTEVNCVIPTTKERFTEDMLRDMTLK